MAAARTTPSTLLFDGDWQNPKIGVDEGLANQDCIISNLKAVLRSDAGAYNVRNSAHVYSSFPSCK